MADMIMHFMHPTDGRVITATVSDNMTGLEMIDELVANDFIPANCEGYNLAIKGGNQLDNYKTLSENKVKDNNTIRIIPATDGC